MHTRDRAPSIRLLACGAIVLAGACSFDPTGLGPPPGAACGNGELDPREECDDGNVAPGDGCGALCLLEEPCGPASCALGCCDGEGLCHSGSADGACGAGGAACVDCGATDEICGVTRACEVPSDCTLGDTLACGDCGERLCDAFGEWGPCEGEGECGPGQVETGDPCSYCGLLERTCQAECTWGGWICEGQGVCLPGETELGAACGACGHEERLCAPSCTWGGFACEDPGVVTYFEDQDVDGYGDPNVSLSSCGQIPPGFVLVGTDCDDANPDVNPMAMEACGNCVDENCDGQAQACDQGASITLAPDPPYSGVSMVVTVSSSIGHTCVGLAVRSSAGMSIFSNPTVAPGPPFYWIWNITAGQAGLTTYTFVAKPVPCESGEPLPVICRRAMVQ